MELKEVLNWINRPDELNDPRIVDTLLFEVSGFLGDYEERLAAEDQQVAVKRLALVEVQGSVAKAEAHLKVEPIYIQMRETERRIRQLKAFKSNLRRRYEILTGRFN